MQKRFRKYWSNQDGNIGMMAAIVGPAVLAASALAIETNILFDRQSSLQSALDAATLAAATTDASLQTSVARDVFDIAVGDTTIDFGNDGFEVVRDGDFLVGTAEGTVDTFFGGLLTASTNTVRARSVVGFSREVGSTPVGTVQEAGTRACIIALRPQNEGLIFNGGSAIMAPDCVLHVHSRQNNTVTYDGSNGAPREFAKICVAGSRFGNNNGRLSADKFETNCDVAPDPYAGNLPEATVVKREECQDYGKNNSNQSQNPQPGYYCNTSRKFEQDTEFSPGTYFIQERFNIDRGRWTGKGVTFVFLNGGGFNFNSSFGGIDMTGSRTGDYANFFMVDENGTNNFNLNSNNELKFTGAVYMPKRNFTYNSGSTTISTATNFVVNQMIINGGSKLAIESSNTAPPVPGVVYAEIEADENADAGNGIGDGEGDGTDSIRVASSEGMPFLVQ